MIKFSGTKFQIWDTLYAGITWGHKGKGAIFFRKGWNRKQERVKINKNINPQKSRFLKIYPSGWQFLFRVLYFSYLRNRETNSLLNCYSVVTQLLLVLCFTLLLFAEYRYWKLIKLLKLTLVIKASCIVSGRWSHTIQLKNFRQTFKSVRLSQKI